VEKLLKHQQIDPPRLEHFRQDVPPGLAPLVSKMLAKRPEDRYQTPAAVVEAFAKARGFLSSGTTRVGRPYVSKRKVVAWLAAGVLLAGMVLLTVLLAGPGRRPLGTGADGPTPSLKAALPKETRNSLAMRFVLIPAGRGPAGTAIAELIVAEPFYLGAQEVTVGNFQAFVKETGYQTRAEKAGNAYGLYKGQWATDPSISWRSPGWTQTGEHPVVCVDFYEAREFCDWLSKKEGMTYRLPLAGEWEYACRAGTTTSYSFGDNVTVGSKYAWTSANAGTAQPVGRLAPNPWGLYDMLGNAWEWCGPLEQDGQAVMCGGSWLEGAAGSGARLPYAANSAQANLGFRVLLEVPRGKR
jgi:formylglycine-generating enzyme required for sulfatase activity